MSERARELLESHLQDAEEAEEKALRDLAKVRAALHDVVYGSGSSGDAFAAAERVLAETAPPVRGENGRRL